VELDIVEQKMVGVVKRSTGLSTHAILLALNVSLLLAPIGALMALRRRRDVLARFFRFGWPISLWASLQATQAFLERAVLATRLPPAEFGSFISAADVIVRGVGLLLMPVVTVLHPRLMASAGASVTVGHAERRILRKGLALVALGGAAATVCLVALKGPLALLFPGLAGLPRSTVALLGIAATSWVLALLGHKPLEIAGRTFAMSAWMAGALVLQLILLVTGFRPLGVAVLPVASVAAAALYVAGCTWSARASGRIGP
jgi:hypothetical protein